MLKDFRHSYACKFATIKWFKLLEKVNEKFAAFVCYQFTFWGEDDNDFVEKIGIYLHRHFIQPVFMSTGVMQHPQLTQDW